MPGFNLKEPEASIIQVRTCSASDKLFSLDDSFLFLRIEPSCSSENGKSLKPARNFYIVWTLDGQGKLSCSPEIWSLNTFVLEIKFLYISSVTLYVGLNLSVLFFFPK